MADTDEQPLLSQLDSLAPASLKEFDAFPKLPQTYKARSGSRGFITALVGLAAFLLVLNDLAEFTWGWTDHQFSVDPEQRSYMDINVDMVIKMPCAYLSVDLRDAVGDRLYLSSAFRRDGTLFDIGQATLLKEHAAALSVRQAVQQSRSSRGFFDWLFRGSKSAYRPTYNHKPDGNSCRIYGSLRVKKVTANLHITTAGHGYQSMEHVPHHLMNLSHVIDEFSFGPYLPDLVQPLDDSFEVATDPFIAYQYFLHVVPTTYIAPRAMPVRTNQYSVTHYTRVLQHGRGTPGIFFKFDLDPLAITITQRTTSIVQLLIRVVGVVGGIFVCTGYAVRITTRAVEAVTGPDESDTLVAASASGARVKNKWTGGDLRSRPSVIRQGGGWSVDNGSPYGTGYGGSPVSSPALNRSPWSTQGQPSPFLSGQSPSFGPAPGTPLNGTTPLHSPNPSTSGLGFAPPPRGSHQRQQSMSQPQGSAPSTPSMYAHFPPTPNPAAGGGFPSMSSGGSPHLNGVNGNGLNGNGEQARAAVKDPKKDD